MKNFYRNIYITIFVMRISSLWEVKIFAHLCLI